MQEIAPGVAWLSFKFVNVYFIGEPGSPWFLVDTAISACADTILREAAARYGTGAKPEAILLTHGHPDHSGSAAELARRWDVPIYVHPRELPFVTGESTYPPPDPTVGGTMAFLTRFFPMTRLHLGDRVQVFPPEGHIPDLPDWRWLPTPGHSPGHVSFYREKDGVLLAGDALTTIDTDSFFNLITRKQIIARPPTPVTCDWEAARRSVGALADTEPSVLACGHGVPLTGDDTAQRLSVFADYFPIPAHGRYIYQPAITSAEGIAALPPAPDDPLGRAAAVAGIAVFTGLVFVGIAALTRTGRKSEID